MKVKWSLFVLFTLSVLPTAAQLQFSEAAVALGFANTTYGTGHAGGGLSFFDFNNDGWDDITLSSQAGYPIRFFKNNGGSFSEINLGIDQLFETKTVQWVDFDNDGDYDLFVTSNTDSNQLYENNGNLQFTDITVASGLSYNDHRTYGAAWGDYNNDGWLDLFLSSRNPENFSIPNILYKNNGDGTFTNVNALAGISMSNELSLCASFLDYNNDGWQDIYISNDKYETQNLLYRNNGNGTFTEVGAASGTNVAMDSMSTTVGDYNRDGFLDIYITNSFQGNVFYRNNGNGTFTDIADQNGTLMESYAWGAVFLDAENDSDNDLYVSSEYDNNSIHLSAAFYENNGNGMYAIPQGIGFENDLAESYGNAIGDVNNDGYPEIAVLNYFPDNMYLWKNESAQENNWLKVKLQGVESNRQGIGSWIEISVNGQKQYNYTLCGEGYLGQNSAYEFFGLGTATSIDYIKVTWLSGIVDLIVNPSVNTAGTIVEGSNILTTKEVVLPPSVIVYPNPGTGNFNIVAPAISNYFLTIFDTQGRALLSKEMDKSQQTIDLSGYAIGMYIFKIETETMALTRRVLLK